MEQIPLAPPLAKPASLHVKGGIESYVTSLYSTLFNLFQRIAVRVNAVLPKDGTEAMTRPLPLKQYATADLPAASAWTGSVVWDSTVGKLKYSDGSSWRVFGGFAQVEMVMHRDAGTAVNSAVSTTYAFPGTALTASTFQLYAASFAGMKLRYARWLVAWNPNTSGATASGVRLIHADSGPTNITQIAEFTATGSTPRTDAVEVTSDLNTLLAGGSNKTIGYQAKGDGTNACNVYLSVIECVWET